MKMNAKERRLMRCGGIVERFGHKLHSIEGAILFATRPPNRLT